MIPVWKGRVIMPGKFSAGVYQVIRWCVKTVYPKIKVVGTEKLPQEPVILVGNHCKMNGPISSELYAPGVHYTWCAGQMMHLKDVPRYAYQDFWANKPRLLRPFYKLLSYVIAPLSVCVFNNANTIGVYHDTRILSTFKNTVVKLQEGANIVIFPEHDEDYNHILCEFQDKFIDIARLYYKRTGQRLAFVPMYLAPKLKSMHLGEAVRFDPERPMEEERIRIRDYLMESITQIAVSLPEHKVVPYRNIPKRLHPSNKSGEVIHEEAGG